MKKNLFVAIFGLLLVFYSCQQEDTVLSDQSVTQESKAANHFYGVATPPNQDPGTKGVAQRSKLWKNGSRINVTILNDPYGAYEKIKKYAREWEQYANVKFNIYNGYDKFINSDVRIEFDSNNGKSVTWSYTGTDSKLITDQKKPTANFADWNYLSEEEQRGDVLRLFGQILGLELEHRHLDFDPGWKSESKIESLWEGDINDIPWEELKEYVFTPLEKADIEQTAKYDEESIMIWPFPRGYAVNTARDYNNQLSDLDMDFIGELYPRENLEKVITFRLIYLEGESHGPQGLELYLWTSVGTSWKTIPLVDYGDGTIHSEVDRYIYSETGIYDVTVYADPSEITNISINGEAGDDNVIVGLNLYGLTNLLDLDLGNIADSHLDLSQSPNLKGVSITNAYFDSELIAANIDKFSWDYFKKISEAPITFNLHGLESLSTIDLYNVLNPQFYNLYYCTNLKSINIDNNFYMNGGLIAGYPASETRSVETSSSDEGLLNIVNNLPSNSGKIKIKNSNNSDLTKINNIVSSKGWTLEN